MQLHIGGPGRVGAGVISDHGVETKQGLDQVGREPAVEIITGGLGQQFMQPGRALLIEGAQFTADPE